MSNVELRRSNLNLLPVLEALLETRSVTESARRLHVSQSAVSHSLARLREMLGDSLLMPSGRSFVLTPRAVELAASLPSALDGLERALAPSTPFEPASTQRTFRIATLDYFELVLIGELLATMRLRAPRAKVVVDRISPGTIPALLAGDIDLALVGETSLPRHPLLERRPLYEEPFAVMMRRGHPAAKRGRVSLHDYLAYPHVVVTVEGRLDGAVDRALERHKVRREVALRVPHFATAPLAVAASDAICTIASRVAHRAQELYPVVVRKPPIALPSPTICAVWSRRAAEDPAASWFRGLFLDPSGPLRVPDVPRARRR